MQNLGSLGILIAKLEEGALCAPLRVLRLAQSSVLLGLREVKFAHHHFRAAFEFAHVKFAHLNYIYSLKTKIT